MDEIENKNLGVIIVPPTPTDFIAGVQSQIAYEVKNPSGDWAENLSADEMQIGLYFDTKACVSFSALNCIEAQINRMLATGEITKEYAADWLDENGKANLSDRFLAKMSGTTEQGNSLQKVCDTLRHFGAVAEKDWNYPRLQRTPVFDWNDFYAEIPDEVKAKGQRFLEKFEIQYEWVQDGDFAKHLKQAPLQIAIGLCAPWNTEQPIAGCGIKPAAHAITLYAEDGGQHKVLDQYEPYRKTLGSDYSIQWIMKIIIKKKNNMYDLIKSPVKGGIFARKGKVVRHLANWQTLVLGGKDPDKQWVFNNTPNEVDTVPMVTAAEWGTYTETDELHIDPKD